MPLMKGPAPIRHTLKYLEAGSLYLKNFVKIMIIHHNDPEKDPNKFCTGISQMIFWDLPQIQYKNPKVQIMQIKNMTPTPFILFYFDDKQKMYMDIFNKTRTEIMDFIRNNIAKTTEELKEEREKSRKILNPANFGTDYDRECISLIPGQVFNYSLHQLPDRMRGKMIHPEGRSKKPSRAVWAIQ